MAACDLSSLLADSQANRFSGVTPDIRDAVILQLLCNIANMASCDLSQLLADAQTSHFTGLTPDRHEAVLLQLLCNIAGGSGSGTITQQAGPVSGWAAPADTTVTSLKWNSTDGIIYVWNVDTQAWEPTA